MIVDPPFHGMLNIAKVDKHSSIVKLFTFDGDLDSSVMSVQIAAFPLIIEKAMPITKSDFLCESKNDSLILAR